MAAILLTLKLAGKRLFNWLIEQAQNPVARQIVLGCLVLWAVMTCSGNAKKLRSTRQDLRVSEGLISRLREDSTNQQNIIKKATAKIKIDYEKQATQLRKDSVRAAGLDDDQLQHENDSLLSANRDYLRKRAAN